MTSADRARRLPRDLRRDDVVVLIDARLGKVGIRQRVRRIARHRPLERGLGAGDSIDRPPCQLQDTAQILLVRLRIGCHRQSQRRSVRRSTAIARCRPTRLGGRKSSSCTSSSRVHSSSTGAPIRFATSNPGREIGVSLAPEPAANPRRLHGHLFRRQSGSTSSSAAWRPAQLYPVATRAGLATRRSLDGSVRLSPF
jgi:hypothetical protein